MKRIWVIPGTIVALGLTLSAYFLRGRSTIPLAKGDTTVVAAGLRRARSTRVLTGGNSRSPSNLPPVRTPAALARASLKIIANRKSSGSVL